MASQLVHINIKVEPDIKADMEKIAKQLNLSLTSYCKSLHFMYRRELFGKMLQEMSKLIQARNINFLDMKLKDLFVLLITDKGFNQLLNKSVDQLGLSKSPIEASNVPSSAVSV